MLSGLLLAFTLLPLGLSQSAPAPTTQPAPALIQQVNPIAPTTQAATTQPGTVVVVPAGSGSQTIGEVFGKTRFGQLFEGKQTVTLDQIRNPAFWLDSIRDLVLTMLAFIPRLIVAFLFLIFFWLVYRAIRKLVLGSMNRAKVDPSIRDMLGHLIKWSVMGFGLVIACNQVGIQIAALLTGVGIIGIAVGFAAQETLANFIAGVVIFWDKPFKVGDWVDVESELETTYGKVQRVTFRSTRMLDLNGQLVIYPNTHMLSRRVSNHTAHPLTRVTVTIGIAYRESIDAARQLMLATTRGDGRIATDPAPTVVVDACADSSVNLLLRFWVRDESLEHFLRHEYTEKCKKALDAGQISIPFPHLQLLVEETPAIERLAGGPIRRAG
jgi:small conductance mechanosensitive channel